MLHILEYNPGTGHENHSILDPLRSCVFSIIIAIVVFLNCEVSHT